MNTLEIKEKRNAISKKMESMLDKAQSEKRAFSDAETSEYKKLKEERDELTNKLDSLEAFLAEQKAPKKSTTRRFSYVEAIKALVEGRSFDEPESVIDGIGAKTTQRSSERSLIIPMQKRSALQATVTNQGIEDVSTDLLDLVTPLENELIAARAGATFLTGLQGNIQIPRFSGVTAGWAGEVGAASDGGGTFDTKTLSPKRITSYVDISRQLLIQANDSVDAYIQSNLVEAVRQTLESTMFSASAATSTAPAGLLNGVTAQTDDATYGLLVDSETALLKKNYKNLAWIASYDASGILKQTPKVSGQAIMLMENGLIDGRPVYESANVATKGLILGAFNELTIGQWGGIEVIVDPYSQAVNGTVRLVVNSYWDYAARGYRSKAGSDVAPFTKLILK